MNRSKVSELLWVKPEAKFRFEERGVTVADPLSQLINEVGIPTLRNAQTPLEEAVFLLQIAAEVEHALLVQYLYAVYSLDVTVAGDQLRTIIKIAEQEMGHLLTVQNLLLFIRHGLHFDRGDLKPDNELDPFPFVLEPLTKSSLAKYVAAEMPIIDDTNPLKAEVDKIAEEAKVAAMGQAVHRVGLIYAKIYWLFQESDTPEGAWLLNHDGFPSGFHLSSEDFESATVLSSIQADELEWRASSAESLHIDPVTSRQEALTAIDTIARQGEGLTDQNNSHFQKFLTIYRQLANSSSPFSLEVPTYPNTLEQPQTNPDLEKGRITNPTSRLWAKLFNSRYHILLLAIAQSLSLDKSTEPTNNLRKELIGWAFEEMNNTVKSIAKKLTKLPRKIPSQTDVFAGAPFELPEEVLPVKKLDQWQLQKTLLAESNQLIDKLKQQSDLDPIGRGLLAQIKQLNDRRTATIEAQIQASSTP
ncbi:ferritin-like protein [Aetokthonos hydrillicola Thurmond2011]|jgi:rubrerythrin|uniref:Ferritin-like protein n=1 Tax=Aetokthonos hydrillicola Thurmond2011 TaxID=2712845 RepID=A0AAP5I2Q4_9CYAN|nr:ferritin-like domain-containing protein [Aetokthonos hydrillicola]MBO3457318.1 hypothetical protein [Aetokthonos hydrillicola CCALA 1050]MBW4586666.1 ferritin-like protein [Aetokthonos hydrillicola CCALA 1050]MDR9894007.1 ferritin-like protein [Aetokthonos hydrillicola Thurmond2011]